jgi:lysosomal alpha-mannosidase
MLYSTPKKYVEEIKKTNETWSVRKDDTFPYSQSINSFWSGFYSSRPVLKEKARSLSHLL